MDQEFIKGMSNILFGIFNWYVLVAKDGQEFYTSDDPVSKLYTDHSPYGSPEFDQLIVFPLAPSVCLLLINKDLEKVIDVGAVKPNEFNYVEDRWLFKCNLIIAIKAKRFIFSKENNFDIVNNLIKNKKAVD
ncbi:MAG: DUF4238 domain-containing protein [Clostridia bacterium]|nr:DUF4238 domain-containing protein [Clostridia bacterium]